MRLRERSGETWKIIFIIIIIFTIFLNLQSISSENVYGGGRHSNICVSRMNFSFKLTFDLLITYFNSAVT
jgi:hypothetical protein